MPYDAQGKRVDAPMGALWKDLREEAREEMMLRNKRLILLLALLFALSGCHESRSTEDSALLAAARTGHSGTVKDMIASGADVNVRDEHGNTALIEAARNGHDDVVEALLNAGADMKAKNRDGKTALMLATQGGHEDTAQVLRERGAVE